MPPAASQGNQLTALQLIQISAQSQLNISTEKLSSNISVLGGVIQSISQLSQNLVTSFKSLSQIMMKTTEAQMKAFAVFSNAKTNFAVEQWGPLANAMRPQGTTVKQHELNAINEGLETSVMYITDALTRGAKLIDIDFAKMGQSLGGKSGGINPSKLDMGLSGSKDFLKGFFGPMSSVFTTMKQGYNAAGGGAKGIISGGLLGGLEAIRKNPISQALGAGVQNYKWSQMAGEGKGTSVAKGIYQGGKSFLGAGASQVGAMMKPLVSGFAQMGPQMLAMSIIIEPLTAFLQGLLEPLQPLTDFAGSFGEILGTSLMPAMTMIINNVLVPLMPLVLSLSQLLTPFLSIFIALASGPITLVVNLLGLLTPGIAVLATAMQPLTTIASDISNMFATMDILGALGKIGNDIWNWITVTVPNAFKSGVDTIINYVVGAFQQYGVIYQVLNGGGADKNYLTWDK